MRRQTKVPRRTQGRLRLFPRNIQQRALCGLRGSVDKIHDGALIVADNSGVRLGNKVSHSCRVAAAGIRVSRGPGLAGPRLRPRSRLGRHRRDRQTQGCVLVSQARACSGAVDRQRRRRPPVPGRWPGLRYRPQHEGLECGALVMRQAERNGRPCWARRSVSDGI